MRESTTRSLISRKSSFVVLRSSPDGLERLHRGDAVTTDNLLQRRQIDISVLD